MFRAVGCVEVYRIDVRCILYYYILLYYIIYYSYYYILYYALLLLLIYLLFLLLPILLFYLLPSSQQLIHSIRVGTYITLFILSSDLSSVLSSSPPFPPPPPFPSIYLLFYSHSFYTCRCLLLDTYISDSSPNQTI